MPQKQDKDGGGVFMSDGAEHDFSLGPWWLPRTINVVCCVKFTENVGRNHQPNYLPSVQSTTLIFTMHSNWGGGGIMWRCTMTNGGDYTGRWREFDREGARGGHEGFLEEEFDKQYEEGLYVFCGVVSLVVSSGIYQSNGGQFAMAFPLFAKVSMINGIVNMQTYYMSHVASKFTHSKNIVLSLTKEIDDAFLDLIKDFKAGGRPKQANMRLMDVPE
ncbi:hypothetical protein ACHAW6_013342 [Cyclotella cf. meneghiniana]